MEKARMLGMEEAVAGGTEGGRSPTGVPPATAAATVPGAPAAGNGKLIPDPAVSEKPVRQQRDQGTLAGLTPKRRGRKANPDAPWIAENERLKRETQRLAAKLRQAETIIDIQKKLSEMLGIPLPPSDNSGSEP
jgi:hypothetical protein